MQKHDAKKKIYSAQKEAQKFFREFDLSELPRKSDEFATHLWNVPVHTDREIAANKPDIIIRDHTNQKCQIIDIAVQSDRNTSVKVVEKLSEYKDLEIEIAKMWKMGTETIPVVIGGH